MFLFFSQKRARGSDNIAFLQDLLIYSGEPVTSSQSPTHNPSPGNKTPEKQSLHSGIDTNFYLWLDCVVTQNDFKILIAFNLSEAISWKHPWRVWFHVAPVGSSSRLSCVSAPKNTLVRVRENNVRIPAVLKCIC